MRLYVGNANFGAYRSVLDVRRTLAEFRSRMKALGCFRYYLEAAETECLHLHFVLIAFHPVVGDQVRVAWTAALGPLYLPRQSSTFFEPIQSIRRVSRYVTGYVLKKRHAPMFQKGLPIRITAGTQGFFGDRLPHLYRRLCREDHAWSLALNDPFILNHPTWEYYLEEANQTYSHRGIDWAEPTATWIPSELLASPPNPSSATPLHQSSVSSPVPVFESNQEVQHA